MAAEEDEWGESEESDEELEPDSSASSVLIQQTSIGEEARTTDDFGEEHGTISAEAAAAVILSHR